MWHYIKTKLDLPLEREQVFQFFSQAENLERITPPELGFQILTALPISMRQDQIIDYKIRLHGIPMRWRTLIPLWNPPHEFIDEQVAGPYKTWIHRHTFEEIGSGWTRITDHVRYELPFTPLGDLVHPLIGRQVAGIFRHRNQRVPELLLGPRAPEARVITCETGRGLGLK